MSESYGQFRCRRITCHIMRFVARKSVLNLSIFEQEGRLSL